MTVSFELTKLGREKYQQHIITNNKTAIMSENGIRTDNNNCILDLRNNNLIDYIIPSTIKFIDINNITIVISSNGNINQKNIDILPQIDFRGINTINITIPTNKLEYISNILQKIDFTGTNNLTFEGYGGCYSGSKLKIPLLKLSGKLHLKCIKFHNSEFVNINELHLEGCWFTDCQFKVNILTIQNFYQPLHNIDISKIEQLIVIGNNYSILSNPMIRLFNEVEPNNAVELLFVRNQSLTLDDLNPSSQLELKIVEQDKIIETLKLEMSTKIVEIQQQQKEKDNAIESLKHINAKMTNQIDDLKTRLSELSILFQNYKSKTDGRLFDLISTK